MKILVSRMQYILSGTGLETGQSGIPNRLDYLLFRDINVHNTSLAEIKSLATVPHSETFYDGQL